MDPKQLFAASIKTVKPRETSKNQGLSRAWIRCPSGRRLDLLDPSPLDVEISDIALSLSRISRWAGMTDTSYGFSVAQHSVLVVRLMAWMMDEDPKWKKQVKASGLTEEAWLLAGLCHDGSEGYLGGDLCGPAKAALGAGGYKALERSLEEAIHVRFGLPAILPDALKRLIKDADRASAYAEAVLIAGFEPEEADPLFGVKTDLRPSARLQTWSPSEAQDAFLSIFDELTREGEAPD